MSAPEPFLSRSLQLDTLIDLYKPKLAIWVAINAAMIIQAKKGTGRSERMPAS
jgi:hypothetical protein